MLAYELIKCRHLHINFAGAGTVTSSSPGNTVIVHFEGEGESCKLSCEVKNDGIQTDTVWCIENYMEIRECQPIPDDILFEISGDHHPALPESNYGNHLNISNSSSNELNGTVVYCGSHVNPEQRRFEFKVCGMFN